MKSKTGDKSVDSFEKLGDVRANKQLEWNFAVINLAKKEVPECLHWKINR
jgi:hypothetical protein